MHYVFLTVLFWGITPVFEKIASTQADAAIGVFVRTLFILIVSSVIVFGTGKWPLFANLSSRALICFAISGLLAGCFGVFTYLRALQEVGDAGKVAVMCATYPLVALFFSVLLLKEPLNTFKIFGAILIVTGSILLNYSPTEKSASENKSSQAHSLSESSSALSPNATPDPKQ